MAESNQHYRLVRAIVEYIQSEFGHLQEFAIFDDTVEPTRGEKSPRINGYVPDVYAVDVPTSITVLGEAKIRQDLETPHTHLQLTAFLQFLTLRREAVLILAVPLEAAATARALLAALCRDLQIDNVRWIVLDGMKPWRREPISLKKAPC